MFDDEKQQQSRTFIEPATTLGNKQEVLAPPSLLPGVLARLHLETVSTQNDSLSPSPLSYEESLSGPREQDWTARVRAVRTLKQLALSQTASIQEIPEGQLSLQSILDLLLAALHDAHESVRAEAIAALGQMDARYFPREQVLAALHDSSWQVRETAIYTLVSREHQVASAHFQRALSDAELPVREAAKYALETAVAVHSESGTTLTPQTGTFTAPAEDFSMNEQRARMGKWQNHVERRNTWWKPVSSEGRRRKRLLTFVSIAAVLALVLGNALFLFNAFHHSQQEGIPSVPPKHTPTMFPTAAPTQVPRQSTSTPVVYQAPITITRGGIYSGNWQSLDPNIPAIRIQTTEPVVIEHAHIRGMGNLLDLVVEHANLTVRDSYAYGINPNVKGKTQGNFIHAWRPDNLLVEQNTIEGTTGIKLDTYAGPRDGIHTVKILRNYARNIDGRASNGNGGYSSGNTLGIDWNYAMFFEAWQSPGVPGMEVAWNEVVNDPGKSLAINIIDFNRSGGTAASPVLVHDNYLQGNYPLTPDRQAGGGIVLGDDCQNCTPLDYGFIKVYANQVVGVMGGSINIIGGHDQEAYQNRVVSAGKQSDGTLYPGSIGVTVWNEGHYQGFSNNTIHDNVLGVIRRKDARDAMGYRCDSWWPEEGSNTWCKSGWHNNSALPNPITLATEQAEYSIWQQKVTQAGGNIGAPG